MKVVKKENVIYDFSSQNKPIASVKLYEDFWVETEDFYCGQIKTEKDLRPNIDISIMFASTGPIEIENIMEGDTICITIKEIILNSQGVMVTSPKLGVLGDMIYELNTKIITIKDGYAYFSKEIKLPLTPMIGVIGVAPNGRKIHCDIPGDHGANIDTKNIKEGSKIYLPVFVNGANLAVGDLHACMGDGELSGTGIEISGKVKLNVTKIANTKLKMPIVETEDEYMVIASEKTFEDAIYKGTKYVVELLQESFNLNFPDAYRLLSATCDLRVSQVVNSLITLKVVIPKILVTKLL